MNMTQNQTIEDVIETVEITSDQPIDQERMRSDLSRYAKVLTAGTELSLSPDLDEATHQARVRTALRKAVYFCMLDTTASDAESADNQLRIVLGGLDGHEYGGLTRKQEGEIRAFINAAHVDGKVTFEEVVDFLVLANRTTGDAVADLPPSSLAAARFCLEENGIEPTEARVRALAEAAETTVAEADEDETDEAA
jgi:hypothetical protein